MNKVSSHKNRCGPR